MTDAHSGNRPDSFHGSPDLSASGPSRLRSHSSSDTDTSSETAPLPQSPAVSTPPTPVNGAPDTVGNSFNMNTPMNTPVDVDGAADGGIGPSTLPMALRPPTGPESYFVPPSLSTPPLFFSAPVSDASTTPVMSGALASTPGTSNRTRTRPPLPRSFGGLGRSALGLPPKNVATSATAGGVLDVDSPEPASTPAPQRFFKGRNSRVRTFFRDIRRMGRRREQDGYI